MISEERKSLWSRVPLTVMLTLLLFNIKISPPPTAHHPPLRRCLQLRGMYFDRIERAEVTALIDGIYKCVHLLEDVQFLVQYAPQVLPPTPQEASGEVIWANILALQEELTNKREASVSSLAAAMGQLYPEQEVPAVKAKARAVAAAFQIERFATKRELTKMSQVTAECAKVFPPDFASVDPDEVIRQVRKNNMGGESFLFQNRLCWL